jgi:hypothetical protein
MANNEGADGFSYVGTDENGVTQRGNVMSGTISEFTQKRWRAGWKSLTVVSSSSRTVAGIFKTPPVENGGLAGGTGWYSDVA